MPVDERSVEHEPAAWGSRERLLLGAILALGAFVRFSSLGGGWFLEDQVRDGMAAQGILSGHEFPLVGPHSALSTVRLVGPLYYYLLAIPYGLSADPVVGVAFQNLLGVLSIYLTYRLGREMFGRGEGFVAAALYAVFPMAVFSGKPLWNPGFVPFFSTLFLLSFWRFLTGRRPWALPFVLFSLGVLLQIHITGAIFVLLAPVALLMYRPPVRRWPLATGLLGVALLYVPYVVFQIRHGFPDIGKVLVWVGEHPLSSFWLIAGRGFWMPFVLPERLAAALGKEVFPSIFPLVQRVELALLVMGLAALLVLMITAKDRRPYMFLGLWFTLPFVIVPINRIGVMWYYFDILYPSQFLVIAVLLGSALRVFPATAARGWTHEGRRIALALLVGALVAIQVWFTMSWYGDVRRSGLLRAPLGGIVLSERDQGDTMVESLPLRDKKALATSFVSEFGAPHALVERRAHGTIYQLFREDKGFLMRTLAPQRSDSTLHYLIVPHAFEITLEQGREVRVGAYRIVAYQPTIDYGSWKWSVRPEPGWWSETFDDSSWVRLTLPARQVPDPTDYASIPSVRWPATTVIFRGHMMVASTGRPVWLVLGIRDYYFSRHEVGQLYVNARPLETMRTVARRSSSFHHVEMLVDVTSDLRPGSNLIAFEVTGTDGVFDLDLYELRPADPAHRLRSDARDVLG